jgi:REase_AHJR-like
MTFAVDKTETEVLQALRSRYERDGYTFIVHPPSELLPPFLRGYLPDAIALSNKGNVIIEVRARRTPVGEKNLAQIAERVASNPGWRFDVFYGGSFSRHLYDPPSSIQISELIKEIDALRATGQERAAYVMGWAALEAITRALRSEDHGSLPPMIPSEIVEWLAQSGYLNSADQRLLRRSIQTRNLIVHGGISPPEPEASAVLFSVLSKLVHELDVR